jgi:hypothetical protein
MDATRIVGREFDLNIERKETLGRPRTRWYDQVLKT